MWVQLDLNSILSNYKGGGKSEEMLGRLEAYKYFQIQTKAPGFYPGSLSSESIKKHCYESLKALKQEKVDIYYFHGPDSQTPLQEQCDAVNDLYSKGHFERFGVSNLGSDQVETIYNYCKSKGYVLPTVYQGGYNPIVRHVEKKILPLCRKLGMAFYGYSPLAGGLLAKPLDQILNPAKGSRFDAMKVFGDIYTKDEFITAVEKLKVSTEKHGLSTRNATLRWLLHHSALGKEDGIILGASSLKQAQDNLSDCKDGPLPQDLVAAFAEMWESIKDTVLPYSVD